MSYWILKRALIIYIKRHQAYIEDKTKMKQLEIEVRHSAGLHARPATLFVQTAQKFKSEIKVSYSDKTVNGKSIISMLNLGATRDAKICIVAEGEDEETAISVLKSLIESDFSER
jgi:phosphocarrier protein HPr